MATRPFPRTFRNRENITHDILNQEIRDWHLNDPLGLARSAGQMFQATGTRDGQMLNAPSEPSLLFHSGVSGTLTSWKPQSEIGGGSGGGSGVIGHGFWRDTGTGGNIANARMRLLTSGGARVTNNYDSVKRIVLSTQMGTTVTANVPSDLDGAGAVMDSLTVGDYILLMSDQELGDLARYRVDSISQTQTAYTVGVTSIAHVGQLSGTNRTWRVETVSKAIVDADDVFGIGSPTLTNLNNNTHALFVEDDKFKNRPLLESVNDYLPYKLQQPANITGFTYRTSAGAAVGSINIGFSSGKPNSMTVRAHSESEYQTLQRRLQVGNIVRVANTGNNKIVEFPINEAPTLNNGNRTIRVVPDSSRVTPTSGFTHYTNGASLLFNIRPEHIRAGDIRQNLNASSLIYPVSQKVVRDRANQLQTNITNAVSAEATRTNTKVAADISSNNSAMFRNATISNITDNSTWNTLFSGLISGNYYTIFMRISRQNGATLQTSILHFRFGDVPTTGVEVASTSYQTFAGSNVGISLRRSNNALQIRLGSVNATRSGSVRVLLMTEQS